MYRRSCLGVPPHDATVGVQADPALAPPIAVAVTIWPPATPVDVRASQQFPATLANAPSRSGLSWTETGSGGPRWVSARPYARLGGRVDENAERRERDTRGRFPDLHGRPGAGVHGYDRNGAHLHRGGHGLGPGGVGVGAPRQRRRQSPREGQWTGGLCDAARQWRRVPRHGIRAAVQAHPELRRHRRQRDGGRGQRHERRDRLRDRHLHGRGNGLRPDGVGAGAPQQRRGRSPGVGRRRRQLCDAGGQWRRI